MPEEPEYSFVHETDRLRYRGLYRADIDGPSVDWLKDGDVIRYNMYDFFPDTRNDFRAFVEMLQISEQHLVWAICEKEQNRHIGNIALFGINRIRQSAGFAILPGDRSCWHQDYGEEAARLIFRHGFRRAGLRKIYCETPESNAKMIQLAEKLGMTREALRREAFYDNDRFVDQVEFGILKNEFDPELT